MSNYIDGIDYTKEQEEQIAIWDLNWARREEELRHKPTQEEVTKNLITRSIYRITALLVKYTA